MGEEEIEEGLSTTSNVPEEPTKSYAGWVTACAFGAIAFLFGVLWRTQTTSYNTARSDLVDVKKESKVRRISDSIVIEQLRADNEDCEDKALDDLEKKMRRAESLKFTVFSDYAKISKELESSKQDVQTIVEATKDVKKALKSTQK